MSAPAQKKLIECREMLFAASQTIYTVVGVLEDREMPKTADRLAELASMLSDFSISVDNALEGGDA